MELTAAGPTTTLARSQRLVGRIDPPAIAAWTLGFAVVAYLALSNGGYDTIVRSQVGLAVWWIVLLGALAGVLPARIGTAGWAAIGLLAGFTLWTGLATSWSESAERSTIELGRVAMYLGVLVLALALQGRAAARHTINGLACAIGLVTVLAVLSRVHPQWFPANDHFQFLGAGSASKLSYPLNYWNGLAAFAAIGVPLLLAVALSARTLAGSALAAATLPVGVLCVYLTISRGGTLALVVGLVAFLVLVPRRLDAVATLLVAAIGSALLISGAAQRDALQDGLSTPAALQQGGELLWLIVIVCAGVAFLQVALALAARHLERPAALAPSRRSVALGGLACLAVGSVLAVVAGGPGWVSDRWTEFKQPTGLAVPAQDNVFTRLSAANGNDRYAYWQSALDANATDRLKGIGPGTFEFWWARHGTGGGFIRDAHTLYFETLAETGIVGFALLIGVFLLLLGVGVVRSLRAGPGARVWVAGAIGGVAAFMTSAALDWVWEMGTIACAVFLLGAVILGGREPSEEPDAGADAAVLPARQGLLSRVGLALLAIVALGAVAVPMAGALATRDSHTAAAEGRLVAALEDSRTAERLQPYAASAHLQRALVLEQAGALDPAASAAKLATADEPTNWRTWFVLGRIDARRGADTEALAAIRRARSLNPRSPLLVAP